APRAHGVALAERGRLAREREEAEPRETGGAGHPKLVARRGPVTKNRPAAFDLAQARHRDRERAAAQVAADDRSVVATRGIVDASGERAKLRLGHIIAQKDGDEERAARRGHGGEVADARGDGPRAELGEGEPIALEVGAFGLSVDGGDDVPAGSSTIERRIVADSDRDSASGRPTLEPTDPGDASFLETEGTRACHGFALRPYPKPARLTRRERTD